MNFLFAWGNKYPSPILVAHVGGVSLAAILLPCLVSLYLGNHFGVWVSGLDFGLGGKDTIKPGRLHRAVRQRNSLLSRIVAAHPRPGKLRRL